MALPNAHVTPEIRRLNSWLDSLPTEALMAFPQPTPQDFAVFGGVIQIFNYIELNLRRSMAAFDAGGVLPSHLRRSARQLSGYKLTAAVRDTAAEIHRNTGLDGEAVAHLDAIALNQNMRNLLAHWAARRIPGEDYLVLLGKDERDAAQVLDGPLSVDTVAKAIVQASALAGLVDFLAPHQNWLAEKTSAWYGRYVEGT
ncbi:hypothetical protein ACO2Q3_19805 [Caulobacter sp. KR2-114]|uniref:hypothetical protein n=1 Tax=Caulobacter sp. KR2-114 TaxID=3400912 RepID=UPI003C1235BA